MKTGNSDRPTDRYLLTVLWQNRHNYTTIVVTDRLSYLLKARSGGVTNEEAAEGAVAAGAAGEGRNTASPKIFCDYTHTRPFNGPLSGTTRVRRYQKGKTNLDFTEARGIHTYIHTNLYSAKNSENESEALRQ